MTIIENDLLIVTADTLLTESKIPGLTKLAFFYNWNKKLDCTYYTTLRLANPDRYQIGHKFGVYLHGQHHHDAEVTDVKMITIDQINEWIARLDTGYSRAECVEIIKTMYKGKQIDWQTQQLNWVLLHRLDYHAKL